METAGPLGETEGDKAIVPKKPPRLARVIVEVPEAPGTSEREDWSDEIEKSTTLTDRDAECDS